MRLLGLLAALFIALVGLTGVVRPDLLMVIGQYSVTTSGIYIAAALRICIGLILARAAPLSRAPGTLRVLGTLAVLAGIATLFMGSEHAQTLLEWWLAWGTAFIRGGAGFALVLGAFIAYALFPPRGMPESSGVAD